MYIYTYTHIYMYTHICLELTTWYWTIHLGESAFQIPILMFIEHVALSPYQRNFFLQQTESITEKNHGGQHAENN